MTDPAGRVIATRENVGDLFKGIMIECSDIGAERYSVPGWQCYRCGWRIGTSRLPPAHDCPDDGIQQAERFA